MFSISGLRLYFPALEPWVSRSVSLPSCSSQFVCTQMWDHPLHQLLPCWPATTLPPVLSAWLPVSTHPTRLDECVFFNSLVVGLPFSSIFCQFWLFFVFKLLLSFFWLCKEAHCVYLCLHLGRKSQYMIFKHVSILFLIFFT